MDFFNNPVVEYSPKEKEGVIMKLLWLGVCALISYFVGTINPSYLISRRRHFDIREAGSGNAGGSNALITMGKKVGTLCMIFDIIKAFAVVKASMLLLPMEPLAGAVSSTAVILGHIFPVWLNFRGGKGLACLGGAILAYSPLVLLIFLMIEFILAFIVDYICIVPITASIAFPIVYYAQGGPGFGALILLIATVAMLYKHMENIVRIREGKEAHFSYLWKREKEEDRIRSNLSEEEYNRLKKTH